MDHITFSLIIPTYNESMNIIPLLQEVEKSLSGLPFEIIVADDNSPDETWKKVKEYSVFQPNVRLIRRMHKPGLSASVIDGFNQAKGLYLGVMDADRSHDPVILPRLISALGTGMDMAVGSRRVPGGGADHWPLHRRAYSSFATLLAKFWLRSPLKDVMSGYFVIRRDVFDRVKNKLNPRGYKIMLEILTRSQTRSIVEVPYIFQDRTQGVSKLTGGIAWQYLCMLWDLKSYSSFAHALRKVYHAGRYKKVQSFLKEGAVLDIGCGQPCETMPDQAFLRFLNRPASTGVDIKKVVGPYEFHQTEMAKMPFAAETFDNVVAMEVIEHVHDVEGALAEVARVLKADGVFVMSTPDCHWLWEVLWSIWTRVIGEMWHDTHTVSYRAADWEALLAKRFDVLRVRRHWSIDLIFHCRKKV